MLCVRERVECTVEDPHAILRSQNIAQSPEHVRSSQIAEKAITRLKEDDGKKAFA